MRFITLFSIIWLSIVCQQYLNASDVSGEDFGAAVAKRIGTRKADLMLNESNSVQSEGLKLAAPLNAQLLSQHHLQPQKQSSSVMPSRRKRQFTWPRTSSVRPLRKRRSTWSRSSVIPSRLKRQSQGQATASGRKPMPTQATVVAGRRKRRQTVDGAEGNGAQQNGGNSNQVHYVIAPGDGLEFTCQAASNNVQQMGLKKGERQNVSKNQMNGGQEEEMAAQNDENANGVAGAIPVISGNTLRVVCKA